MLACLPIAEACLRLRGLGRNVFKDTLAERLRRRPAKPMGSPRVGSNPTGVVYNAFWLICVGLLRAHNLNFRYSRAG